MSEGETIRAEFKGTLGTFSLDAGFTAPAKGVTALFGPSGCGKTTVLRCIAGLRGSATEFASSAATSGRIGTARSCRPTSVRSAMCSRKRACSRISRSAATSCSARRAARARPRRGRIGFDEVVELLGVTALLDRAPGKLSGGERQRVAIGRALLSQPKLLLMDEPLSALDRATKDEILPFLERLRDRLALPIVYITHSIAEVERLADQIVLMDKGRVIGAGPLEELQSDPALPLAIARDAAVTLDGVIEAHDGGYGLLTLSVRGGSLIAPAPQAAIGEHRRVRVIAGDVSLAREPPGLSSILNVLPARIVSATPVETHEIIAVAGAGRGWQGRAPAVAPDAKVVGGARPRRGHERLRAGQGGRARAGAGGVGVRGSHLPSP